MTLQEVKNIERREDGTVYCEMFNGERRDDERRVAAYRRGR